MRRGIRIPWIVVGVALLGAMMPGGRPARADLTSLTATGTTPGTPTVPTSTGITITGGFTPVSTDPVYEYVFNVYLTSGSIDDNFSFTITGLQNLGAIPNTSAPNYPTGTRAYYVWTPSAQDPGSGDMTWYYDGSNAVRNPSPANQWATVSYGATPYTVAGNVSTYGYLGQFTVETQNLTSPSQIPTPTTLYYTMSTDGDSSDVAATGFFPLQNLAVPEPASSTIVLLIGGTAGVAGLIARARRRRAAATS